MQAATLNKKEKEELVVKLHYENKTIRQIAETVHMSFNDIGTIIRRIEGQTDSSGIDLNNKSKATQAMFLFKSGKKPIDVAIELDISASEIEEILQEYWVLNQLDELALVYFEIRDHLNLFLKLFHTLKKNKAINQRDIGRLLRNAIFDLPSLENKIQRLSRDVVDKDWRKKKLRDEIAILSLSISQFKKQLDQSLDRQLNQKLYVLEQKLAKINSDTK